MLKSIDLPKILSSGNYLKAVVFGSGRGSNFQAIFQDIENGDLKLEIAAVFSNNADAGIIQFARTKKLNTETVDEKKFQSFNDFETELNGKLDRYRPDLIILAGYIRKIPDTLIKNYPNKIINIHPSLLPLFGGKGMYGIHVHRAVYEAACKISGATVHFVNENYDEGQIILQRTVRLTGAEKAEEIAAKVLKIEHKLYSDALKILIDNKYRWEANRFIIEEEND